MFCDSEHNQRNDASDTDGRNSAYPAEHRLPDEYKNDENQEYHYFLHEDCPVSIAQGWSEITKRLRLVPYFARILPSSVEV